MLFAVPMFAGFAAPLETPKTVGAQVFLGPTVIGPNYKVKPQARSDGMMRLFTVELPPLAAKPDAGAEFERR